MASVAMRYLGWASVWALAVLGLFAFTGFAATGSAFPALARLWFVPTLAGLSTVAASLLGAVAPPPGVGWLVGPPVLVAGLVALYARRSPVTL